MKVGINARFLLKDRLEGIGWFTYETVRRLVAQMPEHEFIFFFDRPYHKDFIFGENVQAIVLFPPARHPFLWWCWFEIALAHALKKYKVDVFFSPDSYLSLRADVKTIMVVHDLAYLHYPNQVGFWTKCYYQYFLPQFIQKADEIISVSNFTKRDILNHFEVLPHKIVVACNGCKPEFRALNELEKRQIKQQYANGQDYFFYLGAVHPRKNVHRLIVAFDQFKQQTQAKMKLLIGGRLAWQTSEVEAAYRAARYQDDILFLGYITDKKLPFLMGAALALTYVSLLEGFGVPLLEAMYCEVPILTSNVTSMPEVVGEAGLLVNPKSINAIAMGMVELYKNEKLRQNLIQKGNEQRNLFNWEKATGIIISSLERVILPQ